MPRRRCIECLPETDGDGTVFVLLWTVKIVRQAVRGSIMLLVGNQRTPECVGFGRNDTRYRPCGLTFLKLGQRQFH